MSILRRKAENKEKYGNTDQLNNEQVHSLTLLAKKQLKNIYLPLAFLAYYSYFQGLLCEHLLHSELHLIGHTYLEETDYKNLLKFSNNKFTFYSLFSFLKHPHKFWYPACDLFPQSLTVAACTRHLCSEGLWCSWWASSKP